MDTLTVSKQCCRQYTGRRNGTKTTTIIT